MKRFVVSLSVLFFLGSAIFFAPYLSYALNHQPEPPAATTKVQTFTGTIVKITGDSITIKSDEGKLMTLSGKAKDWKVGDKVRVNNGKVIKSGNNSSSVEQYKDGEDGVVRTRPGNHKPGENSPVQPLYKDGEDGVNRTIPKK